MHVLILGGTMFLGRHLVDAALALGHRVTLFNRGQHNPNLYPKAQYPYIEQLRGDRDGGLDALKGRIWDAVVDTCGYVPRLVGDSAGLTFRALTETITDTLSWAGTRPGAHAWQAGLQPEREAALLTLWRQL